MDSLFAIQQDFARRSEPKSNLKRLRGMGAAKGKSPGQA